MRRVLVANRGEIARRIMRTVHAMGLSSAVVCEEADRGMPFVREADVAVPIVSYLDVEAIVTAAQWVGADAVHPGYGFLSENAEFAQACVDAGLVFVGPRPQAIEAMASKLNARRIAEAANVPVLRAGPVAGDGVVFPALVKASAGGGGRGMRLVESAAALSEAVASARREASAAFGDDTLYIEQYWAGARHIEVQVLGDQHGSMVHLFERECSIQRRHQKIVEEAPAPRLSDSVRERLFDAALSLARAIDYTNAGTVEFLVHDHEIAFLEMNTRLQVEHPVTEAITGVDLVRLQLEIADGKPLPFSQSELRQHGHAVEARLYAEDPAHEFLPSVGVLHRFSVADTVRVRYDSGVESGSVISPRFDGLLAKAIAHADDRSEAVARLARSLRGLQVHGVRTNRDALVAVLESAAFARGEVSTEFLEQHPELLSPCVPEEVVQQHARAAADVLRQRAQAESPLPFVPAGWRSVPTEPRARRFAFADRVVEAAPREDVLVRHSVHVVGDTCYVNDSQWQTELAVVPRFTDAGEAVGKGSTVAPLPGTVSAVLVKQGDRVTAGQSLVVLDAMKIEHHITAPADGTVGEVRVAAGEKVDAHQVLVVLET